MRRPSALAIGVLVLAGLQAPAAEEIYSRQCLAGCPTGAPDSNELVIRDIYVLSNNSDTKFADWIAYQVLPENIGSSQNRLTTTRPAVDTVIGSMPDGRQPAVDVQLAQGSDPQADQCSPTHGRAGRALNPRMRFSAGTMALNSPGTFTGDYSGKASVWMVLLAMTVTYCVPLTSYVIGLDWSVRRAS